MSHRLSLRKNVICVLIVVTLTILTATPTLAQESELNQIATSLARNINAGNRHTVTVADFTDLQGNVTELGRFIAEELSTQLVMQAKSFSVVERIQLAAILKEHQISISGLVDPATIRKLGQFAGVDAIVTGTLVPFSDSVHLTAKVLDVSTAKVIAVSAADLPRTKAIDDLLSRGISAGAGGTPQLQTTSRSKAPQRAYAGDFIVEVRSCKLAGVHITCQLLITNTGKDAEFHLHAEVGDLSSRIFDTAGNEYHAATARLGIQESNGWTSNVLVSNVPMSASLVFNISSPIRAISALVVGCFDGRENHSLKFEGVALSR